jgi:hypothetical protein
VEYSISNLSKFRIPQEYHSCMVGESNTPERLDHILTNAQQFFGRQGGCLDQSCPFLHDRDAVLADRKRIIEQRREKIERYKHHPTYRQSIVREAYIIAAMAGGNKTLRAKIEKSGMVRKDLMNDRAYCANMNCLKPWKKGMENPLKACKRCKFTMYCSVSSLGWVCIVTLSSWCSLNARRKTGHVISRTHARQ